MANTSILIAFERMWQHVVTALGGKADVDAVPTKTSDLTNDSGFVTADDVGSTYEHPTYTARTGKPTANATPSFGSSFTVSQITSNTLGHVTGATDRTITIPNTTASTSAAGLMSASDKTKLNGIATGATANTGTITGVSANGTSVATSGVANIPAASTSAYGVTKLSSSTSSTSTTLAATPKAVKEAYDLADTAKTTATSASSTASSAQTTANAAMPKSGGTFTGEAKAQNNTSYTTKQIRNIYLIAEGETVPSGANGDICLVYVP